MLYKFGFRVLWLVVFASLSTACFAAVPQVAVFPTMSNLPLVADDTTQYTVSTTISDVDGYEDISDVRVLLNFTLSGGDQSLCRGYLVWAKTDALINRYGGSWVYADATGGGRWAYESASWGGTAYIIPISCSISNSGASTGGAGNRTVTWTFIAKSTWASNPLTNNASLWFADASVTVGWLHNPEYFDVVGSACTSKAATPGAPVLSDATSNTVKLSLVSSDSDSNIYCVRVSPSFDNNIYVQADGSLGPNVNWMSKSQWENIMVTGLSSGTDYQFDVRAASTNAGVCPSDFGPASSITTAEQVCTIDANAAMKPISKGIMGNATRLDVTSYGEPYHTKLWDVLRGTCARGIAGGMDADTYNWKDMSGQGVGHTGTPLPNEDTTLTWMRKVRDQNSMPLVTANICGTGPLESSGWCRFYFDNTDINHVTQLAADWVRYINHILPVYREGDTLPASDQTIVDSIEWYGRQKLLSQGEQATPKVTYWEIGNEPELTLPWCTEGATGFPTPPDVFATRYKAISQAMLAVDPEIKVGPCVMTPNNGHPWLDAILSDPGNQIDFISYHPYGPLKWFADNYGDTPDSAERALRYLKTQQTEACNEVIERIIANNRNPSSIKLIASEYNPSSWQWEASEKAARMSHALGLVENIFTFAELGLHAANYWSVPCYGNGVETPGYKVFEMMRDHLGDTFVDSFSDGYNLRIYTTFNSKTYEFVIWVLNFSEEQDKTVRFNLDNLGSITSITHSKLGKINGETSLLDYIPYSGGGDIDWVISEMTNISDPSDIAVTIPHSTINVFRFVRSFSRAMPDGTQVAFEGKIVTASYPSEKYLYIEEDDRSFGIRVHGEFSGISIGDRVNVSGSLATHKPDGSTPSERYVNATSITKVGSGDPLKPLAMKCKDVGGAAMGETVPGVMEYGGELGVGPNNIGSLVKITGKVTKVLSNYIWVDDGSDIDDVNGRKGVFVRCATTPDSTWDDNEKIVAVTGVVEGSIPTGWPCNRRYIRARTADDVVVLN